MLKFIKLECPCGEPLSIARDTEEDRWVLGHPEKTCSPFIHGKEVEDVLLEFMRLKEGGLFDLESYLSGRSA
jgi:hypothetical protein